MSARPETRVFERSRDERVIAPPGEIAERVGCVPKKVSIGKREGGAHREEPAVLGRVRMGEDAARGREPADLGDPLRKSLQQDEPGRNGEREKSEHVGKPVHAVFSAATERGHVASGPLARVTQPVGERLSHERSRVDCLRGSAEPSLHRRARLVYALPENAELLDCPVHGEAEPRERREEGKDKGIGENGLPSPRGNVRVEAPRSH